jgi:hypothetical protein
MIYIMTESFFETAIKWAKCPAVKVEVYGPECQLCKNRASLGCTVLSLGLQKKEPLAMLMS